MKKSRSNNLGGDFSFLEIKSKIESWCAYQERAHSEVISKLISYKLDQEDIDNLVSHLIANNYLNEERFAEAFTSGKHRIKKWGKNKIKLHLKQKKVSEYSINKALTSIDDIEYMDNLKKLAMKKWKEQKSMNFEAKVKVSRYLYQKGYESDLIQDVISEISKQ